MPRDNANYCEIKQSYPGSRICKIHGLTPIQRVDMSQPHLDEEETTGHHISQALLAPGQKVITINVK